MLNKTQVIEEDLDRIFASIDKQSVLIVIGTSLRSNGAKNIAKSLLKRCGFSVLINNQSVGYDFDVWMTQDIEYMCSYFNEIFPSHFYDYINSLTFSKEKQIIRRNLNL